MFYKKGSFGIVTLLLLFVLVGCPDPNNNNNNNNNNGQNGTVDAALNGTWLINGYEFITFNNGSFEGNNVSIQGNEPATVHPATKGTYTTSNNHVNAITSEIHGHILELDSKWYTRAELIEHFNISESEFAEEYDLSFHYSISGNTLTWTRLDNSESLTLTRKN